MRVVQPPYSSNLDPENGPVLTDLRKLLKKRLELWTLIKETILRIEEAPDIEYMFASGWAAPPSARPGAAVRVQDPSEAQGRRCQNLLLLRSEGPRHSLPAFGRV